MEVLFLILIGSFITFVEILANQCGQLTFASNDVREEETATLVLNSTLQTTQRIWQIGEHTPIYNSSTPETYCKYAEEKYKNIYKLHIYHVDTSDKGDYLVFCHVKNGENVWSTRSPKLITTASSSREKNCGSLIARQTNVREKDDFELSFKNYFDQQNISLQKWDTYESSYHNINNPEISECGDWIKVLRVKGSGTRYTNTETYRVSCGQIVSNVVNITIDREQPEKPRFRDVQNINDCNKCIPANVSTPVSVICDSEGGYLQSKPWNFSMWMDDKIVNSTQIVHHQRLTLAYDFTPSKQNIHTKFKCMVLNPAAQDELYEIAKVYVYVKPSRIELQGLSVMENQSSEILCITYGGRPPLKPTITINNIKQDMVLLQIITEDETYTVRGGLNKTFTRIDNNVSVSCCVDPLLGSECSEKSQINVLFPPIQITIKEVVRNITKRGDANISLVCTVGSSNPPSKIVWTGGMNEHITIKETVSEHIMLFILTRAYNGRKINCSVVNDAFPLQTVSYIANITYAPLIDIPGNENRIVFVGDNVTLTCHVDSNPHSKIVWLNGTKNLTDISYKTSDLIFQNVSLSDSSTYSCYAINDIGFERKNVTLIVKDQSLKPSEETNRAKPEVSLSVVVVSGVAAVIVTVALIGCVTFCVFRLRRKQLAKKTQTHGAQEENNTQQISQGERDRVSQRVNTDNNQTNASKTIEEIPEYASVAPKATRTVRKNENKQTKKETSETTEHQLVYAELELQNQAPVKPVEKQQEATEYVGIDFAKTGTVKAEDFVEYGNM